MNENQLAPCWEFQPYLAENYVRHLLAEIANVLEQLYYHKHALDSNWSEGVRAYDWVRNHLIQNEDAIPGLEMISKGLDYVVALNKVPLQFTKDCINNPKKKHRLRRNKVEYELKWSTKTGHRVRVFSRIDFPIRLVVTHHYIRAVLVRCNIQRYSPLLRELHR